MILPNYWLERPSAEIDEATRQTFDRLLKDTLAGDANPVIHYTLPVPKWQFLCYIADYHPIALHGTGDPEIHAFEPRQAVDLNVFGNQKAVYAAGDGLWAMFFAVVDRDRYSMSVNNACIRLADATGHIREPRYVFSISHTALSQSPWRTGFVYLLPSDTFKAQPPLPFGSHQVHVPQLASPVSVTPLARLEIAPDDFPFLARIRAHEDARLSEYVQAMHLGAPWPDSLL